MRKSISILLAWLPALNDFVFTPTRLPLIAFCFIEKTYLVLADGSIVYSLGIVAGKVTV
jgi:hypothetical protein